MSASYIRTACTVGVLVALGLMACSFGPSVYNGPDAPPPPDGGADSGTEGDAGGGDAASSGGEGGEDATTGQDGSGEDGATGEDATTGEDGATGQDGGGLDGSPG